jgi:hypothetical protein
MRQRGYDDELGVTRTFVLEGTGRAMPIDLTVNRCATFVGLAGGGVRDLSMGVWDASGREVATDAIRGEGALAHVCPPGGPGIAATVPHYLVLSSLGSGAVVAAAFASRPGSGAGFDALFDGVLAPEVPMRAVEEALAGRRAILRQRGLLPLGEPVLDRVAEGEELGHAVSLEADRCYVVLARGGDGLVDVDLAVYDAEGAEVARDHESDAEPEVELCPDEGGRYMVHARAFEGAGAVGLAVLGGPPAELEEPGVPTDGPPPAEAPPAEAAASDPVAALTALTSALETRGYEAPVLFVPDGYIGPGEVRTHAVALGPGCTVVVGAAARAETDLDLYLLDASGAPLDRDTGVSPTARVRTCPTEAGEARVSVKAYGRRGSYALATLRAPTVITDVSSLRLEEATSSFLERGYTVRQRSVRAMDAESPRTDALYVPAGTCVAVAAVGDAGVEDVDVFLRAPEGRLVASASGPEPFATVSRCAEAGEQLRVEVVVYRGSGDVTVAQLEGAP